MGSGKVSTMTFYYHPGLRVKTPHLLRLPVPMSYDGLLTIEHPRGESAWASAGEPIANFPSVRPHVLDFLDAEAGRLHGLGLEPEMVEALIPNDRGTDSSEAGWRRRRLESFAEAGIERANIRALRPTFALGPKDRSAARGAVRKALRHSRRIYRATARWHVRRKNTVKITLGTIMLVLGFVTLCMLT